MDRMYLERGQAALPYSIYLTCAVSEKVEQSCSVP